MPLIRDWLRDPANGNTEDAGLNLAAGTRYEYLVAGKGAYIETLTAVIGDAGGLDIGQYGNGVVFTAPDGWGLNHREGSGQASPQVATLQFPQQVLTNADLTEMAGPFNSRFEQTGGGLNYLFADIDLTALDPSGRRVPYFLPSGHSIGVDIQGDYSGINVHRWFLKGFSA